MFRPRLDLLFGYVIMPVLAGMLFGIYVAFRIYAGIINAIDADIKPTVDIEYGRPITIESFFNDPELPPNTQFITNVGLIDTGKLASYEMLVLVLQNIVDCMKELLLEGVPVKLDGLGTFSAGIEGVGAYTVADYRTDVNIKGIRINFRPEGAGDDDEKLTKKALLDQATFLLNDYVEIMTSNKTDKHDKPLTYQKRTKISQQDLVNAPEPEP